MVSLCICVAASFVVSGVSLYESIFADFEECRISDDSISDMADLCRLSEFLYLSFELSGNTV